MSKTYFITGVSKGVGLEITRKILENGHSVYGISRSITQELQNLFSEYSEKFFHKEFDLSNPEHVKKELFKDFLSLNTPIHGFINNAAYAYDDIITNANIAPLEKMFRVNVLSPIIITKNVIRNMLLHENEGSIIHISSISVHTGYKGLSMYASTKGALEAFSKNSAREWGSKKIRSNCIVAGFMETNMSAGLSDDQKDRIYKRTSLKRPTEINSVAETVIFLLSEKSNSITGQNIFVDSGTI
jgi:3-oxoacyl-[acyl-carrier protein] reductase